MLTLLLQLSNTMPKRFRSRFSVLRDNLAKANIKITFQAYIGLMTLASAASGVAVLAVVFSLLRLVQGFALPQAVLFSVLAGVAASGIAAGVCYFVPLLSISSKARKIDANLPLIANFMAVLASAGMPPERIFRSLANVGDEFGVGEEMRRTIGDIELLGFTLKSALVRASARSASRKFAAMLDGVITTSHMGGDLTSYLREEAEKYKKIRVSSMKSFLESLGGMAEVYVSFMIALPLALVVMLSIMSFLGGGAFMLGNINPQVLLMLLTFIITPAGVGIILLTIDSLTPPR
jgi:flagellar protein FlaJ